MKSSKKRKVEVVVLSDIHLGTVGCRAKELLKYLKTVQPKTLILNGDIIDIWQFNKHYFPQSHMKVIKYVTSLLSKGTKVYYITGNHDEMLRKFKGFTIGNFQIVNKILIELDGKKAWFFHGDVFDVTMQHSKWLAKLGSVGYDILICINTFTNWISNKLGKRKISLSKKIKNGVKGAVKHINNFEQTVADIAIENNYDYVACGHIHQPQIREIINDEGKVIYLNSGDWIENLTALEYNNKMWSIYDYSKDHLVKSPDIEEGLVDIPELIGVESNSKELFNELIEEFQLLQFDYTPSDIMKSIEDDEKSNTSEA